MAKNKFVLEPLLAVIGPARLRDLAVTDVDRALAKVRRWFCGTRHLSQTPAMTRWRRAFYETGWFIRPATRSGRLGGFVSWVRVSVVD